MNMKYTSKDIIQMAIQAKTKGVDLYMALARNGENYHVSQLFAEFAKDEQHHKMSLEKLLEALTTAGQEEAYPGEKAMYLKALVDSSTFNCDAVTKQALGKMVNVDEALHAGITFEKDFMLFLHELKGHVEQDAEKTVDKLIEDETRHLSEIFKLKEKEETK